MKRLLPLALLSLLSLVSHSQIQEHVASSKIEAVTVFLSGAEISRASTVKVHPGKNKISLKELEQNINPKSIQVTADGEVVLLSVDHQINTLKTQEVSPEVRLLLDKQKKLYHKNRELRADTTVLMKERRMILANQSLSGDKEAISVEELKNAADFFRNRLGDIDNRLFEIENDFIVLAERKAEIDMQLELLKANENQPTNEIVIGLEATTAESIELAVSYFIADAGWVPRYDLRSDNLDSLVRLDYRADIYQQSGIDWQGVKLTLSTSNPILGGEEPSMNQWNLYAHRIRSSGRNTMFSGRSSGGAEDGVRWVPGDVVEKKESAKQISQLKTITAGTPAEYGEAKFGSGGLADFTQVTNSRTTAEFSISLLQDIPSDGQKHHVMIQQHEVPASLQHYAVPKLDEDAFLLAYLLDWEKLDLLPGEVSIYVNGTYMGESFADPYTTEDTLTFSLGRDKGVIIKRELLKNYNGTKLIGFNKIRTYGYEFSIRNAKNKPITLTLNDQIPISQDKALSVEVLESSNAKLNEETGQLEWNLSLAPQETARIRLVFSIKYPKYKVVTAE